MRISGPIAAIVVALIFATVALFSTDAFKRLTPTYATVKFEKGYQKIGVIASERIYTRARITIGGKGAETLTSGTFEEVIGWIKDQSADEDINTVTWKKGVRVSADAGIEWVASESNFKLSTDNVELLSDGSLRPTAVIQKLEAAEKNAILMRQKNATDALVFSAPPEADFSVSKMLQVLTKIFLSKAG